MTDAWFENSIEKSGPDGEGCRHSKAMTSKNYLRNLIPVTAAAEQITKPTEDCASPGIPLLYLWGLLQYAAIEIPGCQSKIVDLLLEIQNRPDVHITEQQREGALSDSQWTLWKHLPHFGHDRFRFELVDTADTKVRIANIACADALFAVSGIFGDRKCVEGLARLADTLEDETAVLVIEMIVVRGWVENAGEVMFEMCIKELQDYRLCNAKELSEDGGKGQRELWEGEGGASLERWRFWKERLGDIEKNVELVEETREAARVSREIMERY
ncbi:hypothetical protein M436DRAFT_71499 [Aureobasidium namibiae CBS 147.97]|uniref:Uncharacterized protein n=1 Tax=Aureobasidium namibiae CBS 147.97 TaxID=1043004 RepID=A0A074WTY5_9PEZI|nr:uncharacterized protein M436DRAFT_71499 [Aureobasidium namibiae CBS 147.97]KEQ75029.1 hypothetical protein M436DRAFT_71499 [Aureobasidium namibiae CBS 147.97]